jgi:phage-related protein
VWLRDVLTAEVRQQIGWDIAAVQWRWPVGKPLVGAFGGGLFEVRTSVGKEQYRVLFFVLVGEMVLLHGFHKKTRRAPVADIELSRTRMKDEES